MIVQPTFISPAAYGIRSRTVTGVQTCALPIPPPNPFVWDGSDLGPLHPSCVVGLATTGTTTKRRYWCLDIGGHRVVCRIRQCATTFPNIIDELKPVFGLPKLGTHRCTYCQNN